jgi:hypothetical protein
MADVPELLIVDSVVRWIPDVPIIGTLWGKRVVFVDKYPKTVFVVPPPRFMSATRESTPQQYFGTAIDEWCSETELRTDLDLFRRYVLRLIGAVITPE